MKGEGVVTLFSCETREREKMRFAIEENPFNNGKEKGGYIIVERHSGTNLCRVHGPGKIFTGKGFASMKEAKEVLEKLV